MNKTNPIDRTNDAADAASTPRKAAYDAPRILYSEPLETIAALCTPPGKANPGVCPTGPISS